MTALSLMRRRKLLLTGTTIADYLSAIDGLGEVERALLAAAVSPRSLIAREGATSRAIVALAALSSIDELRTVERGTVKADRYDESFEALASRPVWWLHKMLLSALPRPFEFGVPYPVLLSLARWLEYESMPDHRRLVQNSALRRDAPSAQMPRAYELYQKDRRRFLDTDLWALFDHGADSERWVPATDIARLAREHPEIRARLVHESLASLFRDLSPHELRPYIDLVRELTFTLDEVGERETDFVRVLSITPGTAVALAQEQLSRLVTSGRLSQPHRLIAASGAVFMRADKKTVMAQLVLLAKLIEYVPQERDRVAEAITSLTTHPKADIAARARTILSGLIVDDAQTTPIGKAGTTVAVPGPRTVRLPAFVEADWPRLDADELAELFSGLLENPAPGNDIFRAAAAVVSLRETRPAAAKALGAHARRVVDSVASGTIYDHLPDIRQYLARVILTWLGLDHSRLQPPGVLSSPYLPDAVYRGPRAEKTADDGYSIDSGAQTMWAPTALFIAWLDEVAVAVETKGAPCPVHEAMSIAMQRGPATSPTWRREAGPPDAARTFHLARKVSGASVVVWIDDAAPVGALDRLYDAPFDLTDVRLEFSFRVNQARWVRHNEAMLGLWPVLYRNAVDHLAAQAYPTLWIASQFTNVGTAPVLDAIGSSRVPPGGPSYTALALGLSDYTVHGRARAAEAVAALAESGLFDPSQFAGQLCLSLLDGSAVAGRVAESLCDAAQISAIAGWRVLESLMFSLDVATSVTAGSRLVAETARLATEYGVAVTVPPELARKSKGLGAMAVAVRSLIASTGFETQLALDAAEQARAALER